MDTGEKECYEPSVHSSGRSLVENLESLLPTYYCFKAYLSWSWPVSLGPLEPSAHLTGTQAGRADKTCFIINEYMTGHICEQPGDRAETVYTESPSLVSA